MRELFSGMPDERLPPDFNANVMRRVRKEAIRRERRNRRLEILGYVSGAVAMAAVLVFILYRMGITVDVRALALHINSFPRPDFSLLKSQSFTVSAYVGTLALFLLIMDSTIRRHIGKRHK
jgi:hypothetical protein